MTTELGIWEIAVLALLREAPMHPYQMQKLLRLRHKDEILALKRGSLYHAIGRLLRTHLIAEEATSRDGKRPERTTYRIAPAGLDALVIVLRKIVSTPRRESSEFMAAMSFLIHLEPEEAVRLLQDRATRLDAEIAHRTTALKAVSAHVAQIHLIESEYLLAMLRAELAWVRELEKGIQDGRFAWDVTTILREAAAGLSESPETKPVRRNKQ
jgi:DNA-binding PadR family transcriptional regulator